MRAYAVIVKFNVLNSGFLPTPFFAANLDNALLLLLLLLLLL